MRDNVRQSAARHSLLHVATGELLDQLLILRDVLLLRRRRCGRGVHCRLHGGESGRVGIDATHTGMLAILLSLAHDDAETSGGSAERG
jgi:hypothetical protein